MGISYWVCKHCGDAYPDVIDWVTCTGEDEDCYERWCCNECAEADGYKTIECDNDCSNCEYQCELPSTCNYCRGEDVKDEELLKFVIKHYYNEDRQELIKHFKEVLK